MFSVNNRIENIEGKGENAGLAAFSSFSTMFSKDFFSGSQNHRIVR